MSTPTVTPVVAVCTKQQCEKLVTDKDKWMISLLSALLALLIFSPWVFRLTDSVLSCVGLDVADVHGHPTAFGLVLHAVVYGLIVRALMK